MESYEMKKAAESEEAGSQLKSELVENQVAPENIYVEEVNAEEIFSPDVMSGTQIISEELKTVEEKEEITPTDEITQKTSSEEKNIAQSAEETDLENPSETTPEENLTHDEMSGNQIISEELKTVEETEEITPTDEITQETLSEEKNIAQSAEETDLENPSETAPEESLTHDEIKQEIKAEQEFLQNIQDQVTEEDDEVAVETENLSNIQDYSSLTKVQLIEAFSKILHEGSVDEIRPHAEAIKACFYKIRNTEIQEKKQAFIAEGNDEVLFIPEPEPLENDLKELLKEYKNQRAEVNKKQDALKEENYHKKLSIIEEIKALVHSEESMNNTFQEFNELQEKWRKIGQVPQNRVKDLWENYHYHVELFYDFVKINRELRDLDLRRNMDLKVELCKKAEDLAENNADAQASFKELQKLHESWREIGPVPREGKQELWERFKAATAQINKKYQLHFEQERTIQREQMQKKAELCEMAEVYAGFVSDNPREWNDITEKVIALQEEWKKYGYGPRKENAKIWERFRAANDAFFQNKRNFWNESKENLNKNLTLKTEICEQAEKLKDSEDWKATTDKLITLQKKWKEIGPVPRKQSEIIWKRFRTACDEFFNRKVQHFSGITGDQDENYKAKKALLAEIEAFVPSGDAKADIETLKKFQERWSEIGFVPFRKKEEMQNRFHDSMEAHFDKLKLDDQDVQLYKFKSKIEHLASIPGGWGKINSERDRCTQHLKQLESDINTLGNNVGFFGSSKGAQSLIDGVNAQIEKIKGQIEYLKAKIKIIDHQDEKV